MSHKVYLGIGSNMGNRYEYLQKMVEKLKEFVIITEYSQIYEAPPWGVKQQPSYLNACIGGETELEPDTLLKAAQKIEEDLGREKTFRWGPHVADIDILFYDNLVLESPYLTIPHPGLPERAFTLFPLADIAGDFKHPKLKKTVKELRDSIPSEGVEASKLSLP
ncbi:MAG: 2-amino-4-hydroxy-6-hydroxymethyldihydropteridine diphosphokinase [Patescibacteria group bacterium]